MPTTKSKPATKSKLAITKNRCISCFCKDGLKGLIGEKKAKQFNLLTVLYDEFTHRCFALGEGSLDLDEIKDYISGESEVHDEDNDCERPANADEIALFNEILALAKKHKFDQIGHG